MSIDQGHLPKTGRAKDGFSEEVSLTVENKDIMYFRSISYKKA